MFRPQGYAHWREGNDGATVKERDTIVCGHCSLIECVQPGCMPADRCTMCMRYICGRCAAIPQCRPFDKRLEEIESKGKLLEAVVGVSESERRERSRIFALFAERDEFNRKLAALWNKGEMPQERGGMPVSRIIGIGSGRTGSD